MTTKLLLPILNKKVSTFRGAPWYISDSIVVETIQRDDYALISGQQLPEVNAVVSATSKCIKLCDVDPTKANRIAEIEATKLRFLLNFFKDEHPVAISLAIQISSRRKSHFDRLLELPTVPDTASQRKYPFRLSRGIERSDISQFYRVLTKAHLNNPNLLLTLARFNSALSRINQYDKIIDMTICLESLMSGKDGLRQRFATFISWASEEDPKKRESTYGLLLKLYDVRSAIVHGESMSSKKHNNKVNQVMSNWIELVRISGRAIAYHIMFLYDSNYDEWPKHQQRLALGMDKRIA